MAGFQPQSEVGFELRRWRERRRLTQLELALNAGISARHLSFVETGRSKPGRAMLVGVLDRLEVPLRERNRLLLAAGHAPEYPERSLEDSDLGPVREALDEILSSHDPYPAVAVDRVWNMIAANQAMLALTSGWDIDPALLEPPVNILRLGLHPRGLGPMYVDPESWRAHWVKRLERQLAMTGDEELATLREEIAAYRLPQPATPRSDSAGNNMLGPIRMRTHDDGELAFFGMFAGFDTPFEVTTSELALELLMPADPATAERLHAWGAAAPADRAPSLPGVGGG